MNEIALDDGEPITVEATEETTLTVYPVSLGLMMALCAVGNKLALSIEQPEGLENVGRQDTLVFYWAMTTPPGRVRSMLRDALRSGSMENVLADAADLSWLLVQPVVDALNAAIARARTQVRAVTVKLIPNKDSKTESKN